MSKYVSKYGEAAKYGSPEHRARQSAAHKGKKKSPEHRRKIAEVARKRTGAKNANYRGGDWCDHKREKAQVVNARGAAKKHGVDSTLTLPEWLEAIAEYNHRCAYCLGPWAQLDHVIPMSKGGPNSRDNVAPACALCNTRRNGRAGWVPSIASRFWPRMAEELYA